MKNRRLHRSGVVALRVEQRNEPKHSRKPKKSPVASVPAEPSDEASDLLSSANVDRSVRAVRLSNAVVNRRKPIVTPPETTAESVVSGLAINAMTATKFSQFAFGNVDLTACLAQLNGAVERVHRGDLRDSEALLTAQAMTLNALFVHLASLADKTEFIDKFDRYLRLALKSQGQCRATLETLAAIKNPPVVFARQANVAHGPQQVNNGPVVNGTPARAAIQETAPDKLLEAHGDGERLDGDTTEAAGGGNQAVATVGTLHGPANS